MAAAPNNDRFKQYKPVSMIEQGKVFIPTKVVISYRFKQFTVTPTILAPAPTAWCYAIIRNNANGPTPPTSGGYGAPVLLNLNQLNAVSTDYLYNSQESIIEGLYIHDDSGVGKTLESAQVIYLDSNLMVTHFVMELWGIEHLSRVRDVSLFYRPSEFAEEKEVKLV